MPFRLKLILSITVLLMCISLFIYDYVNDGGIEKWVALLLGPIMVFGIWVFPEAKAGQIRKEAAKKR